MCQNLTGNCLRFELGSPLSPPHVEFGFAVPELIPKGKITMRQAIDMIRSYQLKEKTVPQLADEYGLDVSMFFSLFERDAFNAWVPPTGSKDKKTLLDTPIYQDEQLTDEGVSRYIRLHELKPPSKQEMIPIHAMRWYFVWRPLTLLNRLVIRGSHISNQEGAIQDGLSNALQRYMCKSNDFLHSEYNRLSKIVSSGRTSELRGNLAKWSRVKLLMGLSQRLQTLIALNGDSTKLLQELDDGSDTVLRELAAQEFASRREEIRSLENQIMELLLPPDPTAQYSAARLQLIAGAGGLEAAMFARDLFTMYAAYARHRGWRLAYDDDGVAETADGTGSPIYHVEVCVDSSDPTDPVYPCLRWEAGVHRVQRVPITSKLSKMHTSTVAVTILPVIDEVEVELDPEDLEWEVFRASGAGGQHVNKTESAVRVRHRPTGHVAVCQADRSQHANRETALKALKAKIANEVARRQVDTELAKRRLQVGSLARSDRIRTYNYQQDRITDHRLRRSWSGLATVMRQGLPVLDEAALALDEAYKLNALASLDKPYFLC
ncbi:hypothetical protein TcWFU_001735 [Taenia crassiceps]|uniref:Prokaryotic-type class I peptide chain release factors domain-containing protein n=1 Tax=Taenia crassiceps TaxID=6207 RepID=A0ABR4QP48_9CEST